MVTASLASNGDRSRLIGLPAGLSVWGGGFRLEGAGIWVVGVGQKRCRGERDTTGCKPLEGVARRTEQGDEEQGGTSEDGTETSPSLGSP